MSATAPDVTVEFPVHITRGTAGRKHVNAGVGPPPAPTPAQAGRVPRVAKLMALAIKFDGLVRRGEVESYAELARLGHVTRARISQIMDLLCLAPDIQEAILFLPRVARELDAISEHDTRAISREPAWTVQRRVWGRLRERRARSAVQADQSRQPTDVTFGASRLLLEQSDQARDTPE